MTRPSSARIPAFVPRQIFSYGGTAVTILLSAERVADILFPSLAADCESRAIGVVLSGTGRDGALGLKAVNQVGGVSLVQGGDGTGPQYSGMPNSAIATGAVDLILAAEAMPRHIPRLETRPELHAPASDAVTAEINAAISGARRAICSILLNRIGHDFRAAIHQRENEV